MTTLHSPHIRQLGRTYELCANDSACPDRLFDRLQRSWEKLAEMHNLDNRLMGNDMRLHVIRDALSVSFAFGIVNPTVSEEIFERRINQTRAEYRPEGNAYRLTHDWYDPKTGTLDVADKYDHGVTHHDIRMIHLECTSAIYTTLEGDSRNIDLLDPLHFRMYVEMKKMERNFSKLAPQLQLASVSPAVDAS